MRGFEKTIFAILSSFFLSATLVVLTVPIPAMGLEGGIGSGNPQRKPVDYVDPFIGTGVYSLMGSRGAMSEINLYPGAVRPHGMIQLSPDTGGAANSENLYGMDPLDYIIEKVFGSFNPGEHIGGYLYPDDYVEGFSHLHLNGTGCYGFGNFLITAMIGEVETTENEYGSSFRHESEIAEPGYYAVTLDDYGIRAELTCTTRAGFHRYTFPKTSDAHIVVDVTHSLDDEDPMGAEVEIVDNETITGFVTIPYPFGGGRTPYTLYFATKFSKRFSSCGTWSDSSENEGVTFRAGPDVGAFVDYSTEENEKILVKVGVSFVSEDQALLNLETEIPNWNFDEVRSDAREEWNEKLSRIEVKGGTENQKIKFYTALYHSMIGPMTASDVNGKYRGMDNEVHTVEDHTYYHTYSLWDTFRAEHPLLTIVEPEEQNEMVKALIDKYEDGGWLPKLSFASHYTNGMIGDHATAVIADTYVKGIGGYDVEKAFEAMRKNAMRLPGRDTDFLGRRGLDYYKKYGYIPYDVQWSREETAATIIEYTLMHSVSTSLEYAYDDWCLAQVAKGLGKGENYKYFMERASNYRNLLDPSTGFMRPRDENGNWMEPFDPEDWREFTEGNSWTYTFFVPHDVQGLIRLKGREAFIENLDHFFEEFANPSWLEPFSHHWHGNEPSHHVPYLYDYVGQPWKTQEVVRRIMDNLYGAGPAGLPGNDDVGQLSAWYVFSAMGFYPVCPGQGTYQIGSPTFDEVTIHLPEYHYGGKDFVIEAKNVSAENKYIQSATLNGATYDEPWITHSDIADGGNLAFEMGPKPNYEWGSDPKDSPPSMSTLFPWGPVVENMVVTPDRVEPGDEVKISINISNAGTSERSKSLTLAIDGGVIERRNVTLAGGETRTVTFTITREEAGTYDVRVDRLTGSFEVEEPQKKFPTTMAMAIVAIIALVIGAGWYWKPTLGTVFLLAGILLMFVGLLANVYLNGEVSRGVSDGLLGIREKAVPEIEKEVKVMVTSEIFDNLGLNDNQKELVTDWLRDIDWLEDLEDDVAPVLFEHYKGIPISNFAENLFYGQWSNGTIKPEGFDLGGGLKGFEVGVPTPSNISTEVAEDLFDEQNSLALVNNDGLQKWYAATDPNSDAYTELKEEFELNDDQMKMVTDWLHDFRDDVVPVLAKRELRLPVDPLTLANYLLIGLAIPGAILITLGAVALARKRMG